MICGRREHLHQKKKITIAKNALNTIESAFSIPSNRDMKIVFGLSVM